jgi:taurine dioxygenase
VAPFGSSWHSDWSFQGTPPAATILHAKTVPPVGGDTLFADGHAAYQALSEGDRQALEGLVALHSARRPYSHEGYLAGRGPDRSMKILPNEDAWAVEEHPVVRTHPETGRKALWVNPVYTIGIKGMRDADAAGLLKRLCNFATGPDFVYRHVWSENMLTMWDNRSVQHCATGGYDGHRRIMHRTTVAGDRPR